MKVGRIILYIWLVLVITLIGLIYLVFYNNPSYSSFADITGQVLVIGIILLLPIWIYLMGNRTIKSILVGIVVLIGLCVFVYVLILRPYRMKGTSMEPRFTSKEGFLGEKVSYYFNPPKRGDVVIFVPPMSDGDFIARIVGLPGENISVRNGEVYINDQPLNEAYLQPGTVTKERDSITSKDVLIPEGKYALFGDNRARSYDSRDYGFVSILAIKSRIFYIYSPADKAGFVK